MLFEVILDLVQYSTVDLNQAALVEKSVYCDEAETRSPKDMLEQYSSSMTR